MSLKILSKNTRGCGTRREGGLYLYFDMRNVHFCTRLPMKIPEICPCCGEGFRFFRSCRIINPLQGFGRAEQPCSPGCPVCNPSEIGGLMWVGKEFYTPDEFREEARRVGISKRIPAKIKGLKPGDYVFFAHLKGYDVDPKSPEPGVFIVAALTEYQKVLSKEDSEDQDLIEELEADGIQPVIEVEDPEAAGCPPPSKGNRKLAEWGDQM